MKTIKERFESKITKAQSGCWNFNTTGKGYGKFWANGTKHNAHKFAYQLYTGPIPDGCVVMHSCNNKKCVNPGHLSAGSQSKNRKDAIADGLAKKPPTFIGERHYAATVTEDVVKAIRLARSLGCSRGEIRRRFGVSRGCANGIISGATWRHLL